MKPVAAFWFGVPFGFVVGVVIMLVREFLRDFDRAETARSAKELEQIHTPPGGRRMVMVGVRRRRVAPPADYTLPSAKVDPAPRSTP